VEKGRPVTRYTSATDADRREMLAEIGVSSIEPTETETKESLDAFAHAIDSIIEEAEADPETLRNAPYTTPVRRLDETGAARHAVLRQPAPDRD
jgi:glycine cleavage system protein P-like pyridoxal-binding family